MTDELGAAVAEAVRHHAVKVIVLRGAGRAFCAGFDFGNGFHEWDDLLTTDGTWDAGKDFVMTTATVTGWVPKFMSLWHSPKPVIAMVHGWTLGGGSEMALCADLVLMSEDAGSALRTPGCGVPITPACGSTGWVWRRRRSTPSPAARCRAWQPAEVELVNRAVPFEDLERVTYELARQLSTIPMAQLAAMKLIVNQAYDNMGIRSTQLLGSVIDGNLRKPPRRSGSSRWSGTTAHRLPSATATRSSATTPKPHPPTSRTLVTPTRRRPQRRRCSGARRCRPPRLSLRGDGEHDWSCAVASMSAMAATRRGGGWSSRAPSPGGLTVGCVDPS